MNINLMLGCASRACPSGVLIDFEEDDLSASNASGSNGDGEQETAGSMRVSKLGVRYINCMFLWFPDSVFYYTEFFII